MASSVSGRVLSLVVSLMIVIPGAICVGSDPSEAEGPLTHHGGQLLTGFLNVGIMWYGQIDRIQKKRILAFFRSLNENDPGTGNHTQVASWWNIVSSYQTFTKTAAPGATANNIFVKVVNQAYDPDYSLGRILIKDFIKPLLPKATGGKPDTLAVIIASKGVTVQDMCAGSCTQHGILDNQTYVAVGDPEEECPECAWPFVQTQGMEGKVLQPPSGDIGADTMVRLLAGGLAGAVTNPYGDGFFENARGDKLIEIATKCPLTTLASGEVPVDPTNGGSYNAVGDEGTKFLLPALWNPKTSSCWTPL